MHITFISHRYFPQSTADSVRMASMVTCAQSHGHRITVISNRNARPQSDETFIKTHLQPPDNTHSIARRSIKEFLLGINIIWKMVWHKTDVYVITSPCYITALMTWIFAWIQGTKFICDIRDNYPDALTNTGNMQRNNTILKIFYKLNGFVFNRALAVSYVVPDDTDFVAKYNVIPLVVSNGFDIHQTTTHKKLNNSFNILFHGSFGRMYDMDMFNAVAEGLKHTVPHKNITVTVIGQGINADKFNPDYITICPPIASHEVYKTLEKYHLGMLFLTDNPSNKKCFPVKAFEYFGQNMPVVINDNNLCATYIKQHNTGIVADTVADAVQGVQHLYENQNTYDTMVANIKNTKQPLSRQHQNTKLFAYLETYFKEKP